MGEGIRERAARALWRNRLPHLPAETWELWSASQRVPYYSDVDALMAAGVLGEGERYEQVGTGRLGQDPGPNYSGWYLTATTTYDPEGRWEPVYRRVVAEAAQCPTCGSDERDKLGDVPYGGVTCLCDDPWHSVPPVPESEGQ